MNACMIIIEGLIGVGKSTLTNRLGEALNFKVIKEPVEENPYLEDFYKNPKRYALEMQFWLMSRRFQMHQEAIESIWSGGKGVIMDRSIYGDAIFARQNLDDGNIDQKGYDNYIKMRDVMFRFLMTPQITLYLDASPQTCLNRIAQRERGCEQTIPVSYLDGLNKHYKNLLKELKEKGSNVEMINWESFRPVDEVLSKLEQKGLVQKPFEKYPPLKEVETLKFKEL